MKNIKVLLLAAAVLLSFSSCTKRDFTVETGNTPVEFAATTITLNAEYIYIPVRQLAPSDVYTPVTLEIVSCSALHLDGSSLTLENDSDIILTSSELNVAPLGEEGDGESSFEVRLPGYADYQNVAISVKLTGPDTNIETTVTLQGVTRYNMSGLWSIDNYGQVLIEEDEEDYTKFYVSFPLPTGQIFTFPATRSVNTLAMDPNYTIPADGFEFFICYADGSSLSPGSPAEFEFADDNTFASSGFFIGIESGGSYYLGTNTTSGAICGAGTGTRIE